MVKTLEMEIVHGPSQIATWSNLLLLEQGPAAIEEAASFGGKKLRQSYDAVAHFQLESRGGNHDFKIEKSRRQRYVSGREERAQTLH